MEIISPFVKKVNTDNHSELKLINYFFSCLFTLTFSLINFLGNATIYYVSSLGNDSNAGTSEFLAWKSLIKVNNFTPKPGDQILFKRGDEWSGTITIKSSGTSGNPIIYGAYGSGDKPKIYGSELITGWTRHSGNIYKATFNSNVFQLFINDSRAKLARYPNTGYFNITSVQSSTKFSSTNLSTGISYTNATWIGRTSAFNMNSKTVMSSSSKSLTLDSAPSYSLGVGEGFFLCNKLEFLDQAGEWYYNPTTKTVYLWSTNGTSPSNFTVRVSTYNYGINIKDKNYIVINNLEILHSANSGIYISNGDYITIDNNKIISPDLFGVHIPTSNSNSVALTNNYIYQANTGGIRCYSPSATITDNTIEDTGLLENINKSTYKSDNFGTGIYSRSDNPLISYNRIINSGYCGINWKGRNGYISYNLIDGACLLLDDGAGIYTYNGYDYSLPASAGSVVKNNIILNVYGNPEGYTNGYYLGYGIYMDNAIHHVRIENNTVRGATCAVFFNPCGFITLDNNIIMDATILFHINGEYNNSTITNNVFYITDRLGYFKWWGTNATQRIVYQEAGASALYDYNKYISHYGTSFLFVNMDSFATWKSKTGQDTNSTFDGTALVEGESEKLFYNVTKLTKTYNLGNSIFRDIYGNLVSDTFTLKPFTSKILIGKNFNIINQNPVILERSFNFLAPKTKND